MKIYISLPITGHDIEEVEASCIYASGVIQAKGHTPVSPIELAHADPEDYPELGRFTPRQLIEELKNRGYTGELQYVQKIKL